MKYVLIVVSSLVWSVPALAQHAHSGKGPNGGQMEDVAGIDAELLTSGATVTINVFDAKNSPLATKDYAAAVLIVSGKERETVTLVPSGSNSLKGDAKVAIAPGATITLTIKTAEGKSGQARFRK